jgi:MFS family permease
MSESNSPPNGGTEPRPAIHMKRKIWTVGTLTYTSTGLLILFCWLLAGDYAWSMKERAVTPVAQVMLRSFAAPDWLVGLLVGSVPAAIGMILGPIVSVRSDRHRGRWGRRIPYLLIPTPIIVLAMLGLAMTPTFASWLHDYLGTSSPGVMFCRLAVFGFFWTAFEIATITVNTLFGALINDVVPQIVIGRFFALFRAVGLITGIIFNFYLMGEAQTHYFEIFVGVGLLYGVGFMLMCLKVKEGDYPPSLPPPTSIAASRLVGPVKAYMKECFTKPFYLWFFLATTLGGLALGPVNMFSVFHARSVEMSLELYGKCIALSYTISLLLTYPVGILADRLHPVRLGIFGMSLYAVGMMIGFLVATSQWSFFTAFTLHTVTAGAYLTGTASISQRLLPADKFGQFHSAAGIIGAICYMILPPALGVFIQSMNHNYRYVFLLGSLLAVSSVTAYVALLFNYKKQGGDNAYIAP